MAFQSGAWYLVGWDHLRNDLRTFRLDRVRACETTSEPFWRPPEFDVVDHLQRTLATLPFRFLAEVIVDLSAEEARRRTPAAVGVVEDTPEGVIVRVGADDLDWTARFIAGLGCGVTVIRPPELREALVRLGDRLSRTASAGA